MAYDALDRVSSKQWSKEQKRDYAISKKEDETKMVLNDPAQVKKTSQQFKDHVEREIKRLGLT